MNNFIAPYQKRFHLQDATFCRIDHDDAMVATVFKVTQSDSTELILKICARVDDFLREIYFLKYFADLLPVPHIKKVVEPEGDVHGAILMECLPGTLLKMAEYTDVLAYEMGSLLGRIHQNRVPGFGDLIYPQKLSSDPCINFKLKFEEGLAECSNDLPNELLIKCSRYFDEHVHLLESVDGPCMIHRDFRAGNVIINNGKIQGIIDWSSGRASFAEEDFCSMEHGEWQNYPSTKTSFLEGYASIRKVPDYNSIIPLLSMCRAIGIVGFTVKRGTWENMHARVYQSNREFIETLFLDQ